MSSSFSRAAKRASSSESGILGVVCGFEVGLFFVFFGGIEIVCSVWVCFWALFPNVKVRIGIFRGVCG